MDLAPVRADPEAADFHITEPLCAVFRKQLRAVRAGLDANIQSLGTEIKLLNIIVIPLLLAIAVVLIAAWRKKQRATPASSNKENNP